MAKTAGTFRHDGRVKNEKWKREGTANQHIVYSTSEAVSGGIKDKIPVISPLISAQVPEEFLRFLYTALPLLYTILTPLVPILSIDWKETVMDIVFIVLTVGFFAVSWKFIDGCARL